MDRWPIGISTGCFYREPFMECLPEIRDSGFELIEVCSSPSHLDIQDSAAVSSAARRLAQLGLVPYSFHAPFAKHLDISSIDAPERRAALGELRRAVEAAAALGSPRFVLHPGPESAGGPPAQRLLRLQLTAESLDAIAAHCSSIGVRLILENMLPHLFAGDVSDLTWLLGAIAAPNVGTCLDTGHALLSGDLPTVLRKLSSRLAMLHASDNQGSFDDHLPPGEGKVPWRDLLAQLAATGFAGAIVVELADQGGRAQTLAGARRGRDFLRALSRQLG
jgi:sugar phosphate isomerase/epimerase